MKVIDLAQYRSRKILENLEKKVGESVSVAKAGSVGVMKTCFKEWLERRNSR